jgi:hypothetical protein
MAAVPLASTGQSSGAALFFRECIRLAALSRRAWCGSEDGDKLPWTPGRRAEEPTSTPRDTIQHPDIAPSKGSSKYFHFCVGSCSVMADPAGGAFKAVEVGTAIAVMVERGVREKVKLANPAGTNLACPSTKVRVILLNNLFVSCEPGERRVHERPQNTRKKETSPNDKPRISTALARADGPKTQRRHETADAAAREARPDRNEDRSLATERTRRKKRS